MLFKHGSGFGILVKSQISGKRTDLSGLSGPDNAIFAFCKIVDFSRGFLPKNCIFAILAIFCVFTRKLGLSRDKIFTHGNCSYSDNFIDFLKSI